MKRRFLALFLSAALLLPCFSGCESVPEVTLNIKTPLFQLNLPEGFEGADVYSFLKKAGEAFAAQYTDAKVTVEVTQYEVARRNAEIDECFGTENAPDVLWGNQTTYIYEGRVVPIDDIITDEIRADLGDEILSESEVNGRVYTIPFFTSQMVLSYNKELFREAGLDKFISDEGEVQSWTLAEWDYVLSTLHENLPPTCYPMMMYGATEEGDMHIMTLLRSRGSDFYDEDGYFDLCTPEGLAAFEWLRDCNEKGYFPHSAENMRMIDCYDLFINGQLAIYCTNTAIETLFDEAGLEYGFVNFPSTDGVGFNTTSILGFQALDNGNEDELKAAKAFIKFIYETDWLDYSAGGTPVSTRVAEKYAEELDNVVRYIENPARNNNYTGNNPNWEGVRAVFHTHIQELLEGIKPVEQIARELCDDCNAAIAEGRKNSSLHK